ncbi:acyl-CoA thioesterase [Paramicrobacterium agarici]|uniref:Acyl-CoA thioester hydrolase n=1 Tax=Paramicrobacterium agarici TaxID=630514 RepID=A0A2A9DYX1_9MICO|nr:thioesterase family protein [Microbacterium agarici]PFG31130.1 acyl-CoA thioester hydrolase [Microbacterium agarici]
MRVQAPVQLRWGDLDAYNHVNNVELMRVLEEARVRVFWRSDDEGGAIDQGMALIEAEPGSETLTLVARHEVEYLAPIAYQREPLDIQLWIGRLGGASLDVSYEVYTHDGATPAARAASTIVLVDAATGAPRRIRAEERQAWERYLEPPVAFSGRR